MGYEHTLPKHNPAGQAAALVQSLLEETAAEPKPVGVEVEQGQLAGLVGAIARRDEAALEAFYDATVGRVHGLARRMARSDQAAEEITGDVYVQVWNEAARYDPVRSKVLTWLMMICRSRALDYLRRLEPALVHEDPESLRSDEDRGSADDPLDLLMAIRRESAMNAALALLSPQQRQLLALAFFRGLTHQEIATQAHLPLGTVKSAIRRALDALRQRFDK